MENGMDLKPFCGSDEYRPDLRRPVSYGDSTYATNGHIMVRVRRREDAPADKRTQIDWDRPLRGVDTATFSPLLTGALPPMPESEKQECSDCYGRGCEHECPDCTCECDTCGGSGELIVEPRISTTVRGQVYALRYILLALTIPGVEFADKTADGAPLLFRFDGGVGALMPMRACGRKHVEIESEAAAA